MSEIKITPTTNPGIYNFTALALGNSSGTLLQWATGYAYSGSTGRCKVVIQYSTDGAPHQIPNTPPYVIRDLVQQSGTPNILWHPNIAHVDHCYSAWVYYEDSDQWYGAFNPTPTPTPPATLESVEPFVSGSLTFSKLGTNTKLSTRQDIAVDIIVWLPEGQDTRKSSIEAALKLIAPAHTKLNILYERYYIAQTTTEHFNASQLDINVYKIENGTIVNKVPTIDSSYSGNTDILGES